MTYSEQALEALKKGDMNAYKKNVSEAQKNDDDDMLFSLAEELYSLGFLDDAVNIYETLLKKYPDEDELKTDLADIFISDGDTDKALSYLDEIKPTSPNYINALMVEADLYQTQQLFDVSKQKLLEAEKLAPDEQVIKFALAELYFSMGKFKEAIPIYLELIKKGVTSISSVNLVERLGVSYAHIGHFEQAIGYLKQIKLINMTSDVKFETGFTYLQLGEDQQAVETLEALREDDPQYASLYLYLGIAYENLDKDEEAMKVFQEGLGVDEYNVNLYIHAADLAAKMGNEDLSLTYLKKGHEADPDDMELVLKLSNLYVKQGKYQENVDFLSDFVKQDDIDPQIYWNLGISYDHLEQYKNAQENYEKAEPYFKNSPEFLRQEIILVHENGDVKKTVELLRHYLKLVPTDDEMAEMLENLED